MTSAVPQVAVIGDVGGHVEVLQTELRRLGADPDSGHIPAHLVIVQVGDLVHRGPDSGGVVDLVEGMMRGGPGRWVQLAGNHEAHYLSDRVFDWHEELPMAVADRLRRWWSDGSMGAAAAFRGPAGDFLITHAGLTAGFWRSVLDTPVTAVEAAARLNDLVDRRGGALFRTGAMVSGRRPSTSAGPFWAEAGRELVPSWFDTQLPFSQVHGHSGIVDWATGEWRGSAEVVRLTTADPLTRHEISRLRGGSIIGIDPSHGVAPAATTAPWVSERIGEVAARATPGRYS